MTAVFNSRLAKIILPKKFSAITLFCCSYFKQKEGEVSIRLYMHEQIHVKQQIRLGYWRFLICYLYEWIRGIFGGKTFMEAYFDISFEKEAYDLTNYLPKDEFYGGPKSNM